MTEGKAQIVVLSKNIAKGAIIADGDLTTVELSKNGIPDKAVKDKKDIVGKYAKATFNTILTKGYGAALRTMKRQISLIPLSLMVTAVRAVQPLICPW